MVSGAVMESQDEDDRHQGVNNLGKLNCFLLFNQSSQQAGKPSQIQSVKPTDDGKFNQF